MVTGSEDFRKDKVKGHVSCVNWAEERWRPCSVSFLAPVSLSLRFDSLRRRQGDFSSSRRSRLCRWLPWTKEDGGSQSIAFLHQGSRRRLYRGGSLRRRSDQSVTGGSVVVNAGVVDDDVAHLLDRQALVAGDLDARASPVDGFVASDDELVFERDPHVAGEDDPERLRLYHMYYFFSLSCEFFGLEDLKPGEFRKVDASHRL
ncbi:hypothetical protein F2Q70_00030855 [Brassica cretica]|uniref:Uncharacterized protein n=1 Tax=Brassica cretica TaxID=69181 RepID=A0A8S9FBB0_BRACR|nr:hypothetical protein F2Q70_00030855 [Brassica cretica]